MHYFQCIQFNSGIIISYFLTFSLFLIRVHYCEQQIFDMIVEVQQGKLTGIKKNSVLSGKEFYGFLGIPYAKPPVGDLRFRVRDFVYVYFLLIFREIQENLINKNLNYTASYTC